MVLFSIRRCLVLILGGSSDSDQFWSKGHATRNDIVDDIVDDPSSTMVFNVAKIASARASSTKSLTISLRVAGPLLLVGISRPFLKMTSLCFRCFPIILYAIVMHDDVNYVSV